MRRVWQRYGVSGENGYGKVTLCGIAISNKFDQHCSGAAIAAAPQELKCCLLGSGLQAPGNR